MASPQVILNPRGTSGSGKSWLVRKIMDELGVEEIFERNGKKEVYHLGENVSLLGPYDPHRNAPGCDALRGEDGTAKGSVERAETLLRQEWAKGRTILFEGLMVTSVYGRWNEWAIEFGRDKFVWAFFDATLQQCHDRVLLRNGGKPIKMRHLEEKWNSVRRHARHCERDGNTFLWLDHLNPLPQALAVLRGESYDDRRKLIPMGTPGPREGKVPMGKRSSLFGTGGHERSGHAEVPPAEKKPAAKKSRPRRGRVVDADKMASF